MYMSAKERRRERMCGLEEVEMELEGLTENWRGKRGEEKADMHIYVGIYLSR